MQAERWMEAGRRIELRSRGDADQGRERRDGCSEGSEEITRVEVKSWMKEKNQEALL